MNPPDALARAVASQPVTIADVVDQLTAVERALPVNDGVAWFTRLYLRVTLAVRDGLTAGSFRDGPFMERLDVNFAALYLQALRAWCAGGDGVAACWNVLFAVRDNPAVAPLQHALAGMNAHIVHDLPMAVVQTHAGYGLVPTDGSSQHADYQALNPILGRVETEVKAWFETGFVGALDGVMGPLDDRVAHWGVTAARDTAWRNAQVLWALRSDPELAGLFTHGLDDLAAMAGHGLVLHPG